MLIAVLNRGTLFKNENEQQKTKLVPNPLPRAEVSAFYLKKQKSFIPKKIYILGHSLSKNAKIVPKDGKLLS